MPTRPYALTWPKRLISPSPATPPPSWFFFLIINILALLKGRGDRFGGAANSGAQKQAMLAHHLALPHGAPSAAVIRRVFQHLAAVAFRAAILNLVC